jgi:tetratricopeptide (TPR) repeat protein
LDDKLFGRKANLIVAAFLVVLTIAAFWPVFGHGFIAYDDEQYITSNFRVQSGITKDSIIWAFTSSYASNWHPLTWISHMLDYRLFGPKPLGHHAVNLLFHTLNTLLLFFVLKRMTKSLWKSAFVAALFAIHPLHVESVAWAAERKDVLSTFFWMLTMWAYAVYAERPKLKWYLLTVLFFGLGLLSKPTLVTLPLVLLLMDYWPLGRTAKSKGAGVRWGLVWEKMPLFAMSAASSVATCIAQQQGGAMVRSLDDLTVGIRAANALVAYATYIEKMLWPRNLAIFYPHPGNTIPEWQVVGAFIVLACITILALGLGRRYPYLVVGWLWYLVTLVPMLGLIQVGKAAMADRYTYVSLIGPFIILAWGAPQLLPRLVPASPRLRVSLSLCVIAALVVCTWGQLRYWRNGMTIFSHALAVTTRNDMAHIQVGNNLLHQGKAAEAIHHFMKAIEINPYSDRAHNNLGNAYAKQGNVSQAIAEYKAALDLKPRNAVAHFNLAILLAKERRLDEAVQHYTKALQIQPDYPEALVNLAYLLEREGKNDEALENYAEAVRLVPNGAEARYRYGIALAKAGRLDDAVAQYSEAVRIRPKFAEAYYNLGNALARQGKADDAIPAFRKAVESKPDYADAHFNLGVVLDGRGETEEAMREYREAVRAKPSHGEAHANLAIDLYTKGDYADAWKEVRLCRKYGCTPNPDFVKALSAKMPEPKD